MKRRASLALAGLVAALAAAQGCHRHAAPPLGLVVGTGAPITFPAWHVSTKNNALPASEPRVFLMSEKGTPVRFSLSTSAFAGK